MDVQADEAGLRPDPSVTAIVDQTAIEGQGQGQGQLFRDAYPTYADTDRIPAVRGASPHRPGPARWLRVLVVLVALAVLAAGTALGLVKAGIIDRKGPSSQSATQATPPHTTTTPKAPLATPVSTGAGTATYQIGIAAYSVTVVTTTGRSWVSIGAAGQRPTFAGIIPPASSQKEILLGNSQVDVGAGGTKVIVASGTRTSTLTPVSAPFSYSFIIKS